jgi:hypothetical protein
MSLKKLKDEETKLNLNISMDRIVIALDSDGDDISTLVVNTIEEVTEKPKAAMPAKTIPRAQRLLMTVIAEALEEAGEPFRPFADGPSVRSGAAQAAGMNKTLGRGDVSANFAPTLTEATVAATGKSEQSVELANARAKALGDDLAAVTGTSLDKGGELDAPAKTN